MSDSSPPPPYYDDSSYHSWTIASASEPELPLSQSEQEFADIQNGTISAQGLQFDLTKAITDYVTENQQSIPTDPTEYQANLTDLEETFYGEILDMLDNSYAPVVADTLIGIMEGGIQGAAQPPQSTQPKAADPVNLATGQLVYSATDFTIAGAGIDFAFTRTYKSGVFYAGPLGWNWDHSANLWLRVNYTDQSLPPSLWVATGQLRPVQYVLNADNDYYVALGDDNVVVYNLDNTFERRSPDGRVVRFENLSGNMAGDGELFQATSIYDRFGNYIDFNYEQVNDQWLLSTLIVNNSHRVVELNYDSGLGVITSIVLFPATYSSPSGPSSISRTWSYTYDDFGDLVSVTAPATADFPTGRITQYGYSSPSSSAIRPHDLVAITDPNGDTYLENIYGSEVGTVAFGRIISQRVASGVFYFDWEAVLQDPAWTYSDANRPASSVVVTQRNGHTVRYVLSANGNILVSQETILAGCGENLILWRYAYDEDGRQIASLSPQGRISQSYFGRHYYYDSYYPNADPPAPYLDPNLTIDQHNCFANLLATVQRAQVLTPLAASVSIYDDIFPSVMATEADDIIVKYTYEPAYQQLATFSDPRFTTSADPNASEGSNPRSPYSRHLTRVAFGARDPEAKPTAIVYPDTRYPAAWNGATGPAGAQLTFDAYDANGRLLQYTQPEGNQVAYQYFAANTANPTVEGYLQARTVDPGSLNLVIEFGVNEAGQIVSITDPRNFVTEIAVDPAELVVEITPPVPNYSVAYQYGGNKLVRTQALSIVNADGTIGTGSPEVRTFIYNSEESPVLVCFGDSSGVAQRQFRKVYDASNSLIRVVLPRGNSICYEYDERVLLKRVIRGCCAPEAATNSFEYDLDGFLIGTVGPRGGTTAIELDAFGRAIAITDPSGTIQRTDYDKASNMLVQRWFEPASAGGYLLLRRTEYEYDARRSLTKLRQAYYQQPILTADPFEHPDVEFDTAVGSGAVALFDTLFFRDRNLRLVGTIDANGNATTMKYDADDRLITTTDAIGSSEIVSYDKSSNVVRRDRLHADATGTVRAVISSLFEYDQLDRLQATTDGAGNRATWGLDSRGLATAFTDALGHQKEYAYNGFRDRIGETSVLIQSGGAAPVFLTTSYGFDANSNVVSIADPLGNATVFQYDQLDRVVRVINPDGTSRSASYDPSGNAIQKTDEDGGVLTQTFDANNHLTSASFSPSGPLSASAETKCAFMYDGLGNVTDHSNDFVDIKCQIDSLGRCYSEAGNYAGIPTAPATPLTVSRQFDKTGNLTQLGYPSGEVVLFAYDGANHLTQISTTAKAQGYPGDPAAIANRSILNKDWWGSLAVSDTFGNGTAVETAFDMAGRRISTTCTLAGGQQYLLQQLWDGAGNRSLTIEDFAGRQNGWRHGYDSTNRLINSATVRRAVAFNATPLAPPTNPPALPGGQNAIDAAAAAYATARLPAESFDYDAAGNRTTLTELRRRHRYTVNVRNEYSSVDGTSLTYTATGRLSEDGTFAYAYNWRGQIAAATALAGGVVLEVYHDALGRAVGVVEGGTTRLFVLDGANVIESYDNGSLSGIYIREGADRLVFLATSRQDQYVLRDVLESTRTTSDAAANVIETFSYDTFGSLTSGRPDIPFLYAGKYRYASIALDEYRSRHYLPSLGRFMQPDPVGFLEGANLLAYAGNNPLSRRDPAGTTADQVHETATTVSEKDSPQATHYSLDGVIITGALGTPEIGRPRWGDRSIEGRLANAVTKIFPPGKYPSYELRGRDPKTKDPRRAVSVWLGDHASEIQSVADEWGIDPTAIAGAIAWEALENPYRPDTPPWRRAAGPGKVHPPADWAASLLAHPSDSGYEIRRNWALRTETEGYMIPLGDEERRKKLVSDFGAIQYIGAILALIAQMAEDNGFLIRAQPGILTWAYHASDPEKWSNLLSVKKQGAKFVLPSDMMGAWVQQNQEYLKGALLTSH